MEINILSSIQHPNIIRFIDFFKDTAFYYLITEMYGVPWNKNPSKPAMDLFECIESINLTEPIAKRIFTQVLNACCFLAQNNILHRDIKDENILVDADFNIKLIDFGSAAYMDGVFNRFAGTMQYCPPEIRQGQEYRGPEQEVWALGLLLYTLLYSGAPLSQVDNIESVQQQISPLAMDLLSNMLHQDPNKRPTLDSIKKHPWMESWSKHRYRTRSTSMVSKCQMKQMSFCL